VAGEGRGGAGLPQLRVSLCEALGQRLELAAAQVGEADRAERVVHEYRRGPGQHVVGVDVGDAEVVGGVEPLVVVDAYDGDSVTAAGAQRLAGLEIAGVDPSVGAGRPERVVLGGGDP
jgi:hypothetical protein